MSHRYGNGGEEFCQKTLDGECLLWTGETQAYYMPICGRARGRETRRDRKKEREIEREKGSHLQ